VGLVLGQDCPQVPLAEDHHPVGDLGPGGAYEPLRESVCPRTAGWNFHCLDAGGAEDCVEGIGELPGPVADKELEIWPWTARP
jgi:hypothetical protein